jgi:hypothetical protein
MIMRISQFDKEIQDAVLGNCSTIISFRVGPNDAPIIGRAIDHNPKNLQELGLGQARMRTLFNGKPTDALLIQTTVPDLSTGYFEGNKRNTAANFARTPKDVEYALNALQRQDWARRGGW